MALRAAFDKMIQFTVSLKIIIIQKYSKVVLKRDVGQVNPTYKDEKKNYGYQAIIVSVVVGD